MNSTMSPKRSQSLSSLPLPPRCPRCDDDLIFLHQLPWPGTHLLKCRNPRCSYERSYDADLHGEMAALRGEVTFLHTQYSWLLVEVEELFGRLAELERSQG